MGGVRHHARRAVRLCRAHGEPHLEVEERLRKGAGCREQEAERRCHSRSCCAAYASPSRERVSVVGHWPKRSGAWAPRCTRFPSRASKRSTSHRCRR
ncbi:MAG: hypothetical protein ACK56F_25235, partial [bacterium]